MAQRLRSPRQVCILSLVLCLVSTDLALAQPGKNVRLHDEQLLIGPELGVLHDLERSSWVVGGGLGAAYRGLGLELTGHAAMGGGLQAGWGGIRGSMELFESRRARLVLILALGAGGGLREERSLGLLAFASPGLGLRFRTKELGELGTSLLWFRPLACRDPALAGGAILAMLSWVPFPGS